MVCEIIIYTSNNNGDVCPSWPIISRNSILEMSPRRIG